MVVLAYHLGEVDGADGQRALAMIKVLSQRTGMPMGICAGQGWESEDKINMRIAKASVELATAPQFDRIIKNYDLDTAKQEAYELVRDFVQ